MMRAIIGQTSYGPALPERGSAATRGFLASSLPSANDRHGAGALEGRAVAEAGRLMTCPSITCPSIILDTNVVSELMRPRPAHAVMHSVGAQAAANPLAAPVAPSSLQSNPITKRWLHRIQGADPVQASSDRDSVICTHLFGGVATSSTLLENVEHDKTRRNGCRARVA